MSNGYDFFGGAVARPGARPQGTVGGQQPWAGQQAVTAPAPATTPAPASAPGGVGTQPWGGYAPGGYAPGGPGGYAPGGWAPPAQPPPPGKSKNPLLIVGAVVVVLALAASGYWYFNRSHGVPMPSSAAGLPVVKHIPSEDRRQIEALEDQLERAHVHDATTRVYGPPDGDVGLIAMAGRFDDGVGFDIQRWSEGFAAGVAGGGMQFTSSDVVSGTTTYRCLSQTGSAQVPVQISICVWGSDDSLLVGLAVGMDTQRTADGLQAVKTHAHLR